MWERKKEVEKNRKSRKEEKVEKVERKKKGSRKVPIGG